MNAQISHASLDRAKMRAEWNDMRSEFQELVASIPPADFKRPTIDTRWSTDEILVHMIQSLELIPRAIRAIRRGKDFLNLPMPLVGATNYFLVKLIARNSTPQTLSARFDRAFTAATQAWERVQDDEWGIGAFLYGEGYKTLFEYYLHGPIHFNEHAAQIRKSLTAGVGPDSVPPMLIL